jgi:hypothetical protein
MIATNNFSYEDCNFLSKILSEKGGIRTSQTVVKALIKGQRIFGKIYPLPPINYQLFCMVHVA